MSLPGSAGTLVLMNPVPNHADQFSGQGQAAIVGSYASVNLSVNLSPNSIPGITLGNYSAAITAKDSNGNTYTCAPNPVSCSIIAAHGGATFTSRISLPANLPGPYLPSPLTISVTMTNLGGGGGV